MKNFVIWPVVLLAMAATAYSKAAEPAEPGSADRHAAPTAALRPGFGTSSWVCVSPWFSRTSRPSEQDGLLAWQRGIAMLTGISPAPLESKTTNASAHPKWITS